MRYVLELTRDLRLSNPSNFGSETFNVVLLFLEPSTGDEHGEIAVLNTEFLDLVVKPVLREISAFYCRAKKTDGKTNERHTLDGLPDGERPRAENVTTGDVIVVKHLTLEKDLFKCGQRESKKAEWIARYAHQCTIRRSLRPS